MGGVFCIVGIPGVQARDFPFNEQFDCFVLTLSGCSVDKALTLEGTKLFPVTVFSINTPQACSGHHPEVPIPCKG